MVSGDNGDNNIPIAPGAPQGNNVAPSASPKASVGSGVSAVAAPPAKNILIFAIMIIGSLYLIYTLFFESDGTEEEEEVKVRIEDTIPVTQEEDTVIALPPPLPAPPAIEPPAPPPIEEAVPELPSPLGDDLPPPAPIVLDNEYDEDAARRLAERRASGMFAFGSGKGTTSTLGDRLAGRDRHSGNYIEKTAAEQTTATRIGDLSHIIAQGKLIDAVLETAINTDLPGMLRAIVSHDVYAESGKAVLIPKGSRLIGDYRADVERGESRIYVIWSRLIRPDGIDIAIDSPASDKLGHAGVKATIVDNKYFELFSNTILVSTVTTGFATLAEAVGNGETVTETDFTDGSQARSGSVTDFAALDTVTGVGGVARDFLEEQLDVQPTLIVDQGTKINVFVNKDLIFPRLATQKVKFVN